MVEKLQGVPLRIVATRSRCCPREGCSAKGASTVRRAALASETKAKQMHQLLLSTMISAIDINTSALQFRANAKSVAAKSLDLDPFCGLPAASPT